MRIIHILLPVFIVLSFGCGKKEPVQPSRDSVLATQAITIIDTLKRAFEEKNREALRKNMGTLLAENTIQNLSFDNAELELKTKMVKLNNESVEVTLTWHGLWRINTEEILKNRGVADFIFHQETMKLTYIEGDNPFLLPKVK